MKKRKKGQTLLITLLVLTVAITVALSLVARATTDIRLTSQIEESARAFAAAEAGIEEALKTNISGSSVVASATNTKFETSIAALAGSDSVYTPQNSIPLGEATTIWLVHHKDDGTINESDPDHYGGAAINICWDHGTPTAAMEVALYALNTATNDYVVTREAYDPNADRRTENGFSDVTNASTGCGTSNVVMQTVSLPAGVGVMPLFLRLRPYYGSTKIRVEPSAGTALPDQGQEITSTGTTGDGVTRKIVVQREYSAFPSDFDYAVFDQNSLGH